MIIELKQNDIILKQFNLSQASALFNLVNKNRTYLKTWFSWVDKTNSISDIENFLKNEEEKFKKSEGLYLGILYEENLIGVISFNYINKNNNCATIGYWLSEEHQGKGIMTNACKMLINYGFKNLKLNKIDISHAVGNERSASIIKKLGFVHEGHFRKSELVKGEYVDQEYYGLLSSEWTQPG